MSIYRVVHNKNYTVINNTIIKDKGLSWKAKGIWLYAFSRPDDWTFHINDLVCQSTDGVDAVTSGLKELEKNGYLTRVRVRNKDGTLGDSDWTFFEVPQELKESLPKGEFPNLDKPKLDKPPLLSTDVLPIPEKKQQQQDPVAAVFFNCLGVIDIPIPDKVWLTNNHTEDEVKHAIAFATHPMTKITTSLQQCIKWAAANKPEIPKLPQNIEQENKDLTEAYKKSWSSSDYYYLDSSPNSAMIIPVSAGNPIEIAFTEKGFKIQLESALRKKGFTPKGTK